MPDSAKTMYTLVVSVLNTNGAVADTEQPKSLGDDDTVLSEVSSARRFYGAVGRSITATVTYVDKYVHVFLSYKYWLPVFDVLKQKGFDWLEFLVNKPNYDYWQKICT